jgi:hypothetical protein
MRSDMINCPRTLLRRKSSITIKCGGSCKLFRLVCDRLGIRACRQSAPQLRYSALEGRYSGTRVPVGQAVRSTGWASEARMIFIGDACAIYFKSTAGDSIESSRYIHSRSICGQVSAECLKQLPRQKTRRRFRQGSAQDSDHRVRAVLHSSTCPPPVSALLPQTVCHLSRTRAPEDSSMQKKSRKEP